MINYRSYIDLITLIKRQSNLIPSDIDLVVGIPRSGMIPAYQLALLLNKPVMDLSAYLQGAIPVSGYRMANQALPTDRKRRVLLVDDSVSTGRQLISTKETIAAQRGDDEHIYLAAFATEEGKHYVDLFLETVPLPRIFEWNLLHSWVYEYSCVDIDGVLCEDPTEEQNDDGEAYRQFLLHAPPKFLPSCPVMSLVTSRLEKYRPETEAWLQKNGIQYHSLIMLDLPNKAERVKSGSHAAHKAKAYAGNAQALLFIESAKHQAIEIFNRTGKPVFSVEEFLFWPGAPHLPNTPHNLLADKKRPTWQLSLGRKIRNHLRKW